jgi:hypothetical protein
MVDGTTGEAGPERNENGTKAMRECAHEETPWTEARRE